MDNMSYDDLVQLYNGCLCMYKDDVVKITKCNPDFKVHILYLEHGNKAVVKFDMETFSAPLSRIGFVNHQNMAFYVRRKPRRQWAVGLTAANIEVNWPAAVVGLANIDCYMGARELGKLDLKTISQTIKGVYPSFIDALKSAVQHKGIYAFDRQFAVDYERNIYYKLQHIGSMPRVSKNLEDVVFLPSFEYLQIPLLQHYEKTVRTFGA